MPQTSAEILEIMRANGLEGVGDGVLFPWGAKIVDVDGKKMLKAMSPKEYGEAVFSATGIKLEDNQLYDPYCAYDGGARCMNINCTTPANYCSLESASGVGFFCLCKKSGT
ncbi:hypothetical protein [Mesorhizobium sp. STM 4661]|uniref:hypothetical protein n=1 Tax=Mesorhizobium sp. STM 4661 TaxID=1297570 RepID=UPI0002BF875A|nr:hypothetical protein [Mesorhizobium sp. STM 4661]CCV13153.1 hypothetical protein MESS4_520065 [Mesorhizobium sp. STM 4661]